MTNEMLVLAERTNAAIAPLAALHHRLVSTDFQVVNDEPWRLAA